MAKLVECVPNFSEGRNPSVIEAISAAIRDTPGCTLLDVDPGQSTNRTVYTFVGDPESVVAGAINAAKVARPLIDMRKHSGAHPRNAAMDVCPFVPVANVTMEECVQCAHKFGKAMAEIGLPCYLYEAACAKGEYRRTLRQLRGEGEYEGLAEKLKKPEWAPDYGPTAFVPEWGVTATGARNFLIAYNVNILSTKEHAHRIALNIREQGRGEGQPGRCKLVKAIGWFVDELNMAQVSINLDDYKVSSLHTVFEECKKDANELGVAVAGSEIVGLVPLEAILMAAEYYIEKEKLFIMDRDTKIRLAIERLGLNSVKQFDPKKRIIDLAVAKPKANDLSHLTVEAFISSVAARTSAPGGGSVSALAASLGMGLAQMMGWMSWGNKKWEHLEENVRRCLPPINAQVNQLVPQITSDTEAFNQYMEALKLPKDTEEQKVARENAMQLGLKQATEVPLTTMRLGANRDAWKSILELAQVGNMSCRSDLEVGVKMIETGVWGAMCNVLINVESIKDKDYVENIKKESQTHMQFVQESVQQVIRILEERGKTEKK
eukprot:NODE_1724_length_1835_cov_49.137266_g1463_i0.p1 GENE.NODE_1724_length_1835_cov_49.137266_g1463_i0~~NODE_1724_length_1835_cov_49.137266_g1463_i0.p1  ORF type:complete len:548 (-),score=132.68 NODE_1724_length_1835_cov_49.137266_g1463_i0:138-1781(-)